MTNTIALPMPLRAIAVAAAIATSGCATAPDRTAELAPAAAPCPSGVPDGARCLRGTDSAGAPYLIAMPQAWNGVLVVHAHGGPALGAPRPERAEEDARRWAIIPRAGYAYAASVYSQGGVAVRSAAADTDRVRRIFVAHVARPRRTILHGQSWGANVAAKAAETTVWDGVLLSSGVIAGGTRNYDFRLDLRVLYQALCRNHPLPDEPQYPLWMGLPRESTLGRADLAARVDACLGVRSSPAARSPDQTRRLQTLLDNVRIPESSVIDHLTWATWHFQDIAFNRTGGRNPFDNTRVRYADVPLDASVERYSADPAAAAQFNADAGLSGRIGAPVLTVHASGDPTAFVELESVFRDTMQRAGNGDHVVQTFTADREHSYLADPVYPTLLEALLRWVDGGPKPTPAAVAARCREMEATFGPGCRFLPDYRPAALDTRSPAR